MPCPWHGECRGCVAVRHRPGANPKGSDGRYNGYVGRERRRQQWLRERTRHYRITRCPSLAYKPA